MSAPIYCRVGEVTPCDSPDPAPRPAHRAAPTGAALVLARARAAGLPVAPWQERVVEFAHAGQLGPTRLERPRARHRLPDVLPPTFARDLAGAGYSLLAYLDRTVTR
ncbi:MAG TPA: hypothetical protein VGC57_16070 [Cellulomonas sp.]